LGGIPSPSSSHSRSWSLLSWDWDFYHPHQPKLTGGYGLAAQNLQAVLRACPALHALRIQFPSIYVTQPQVNVVESVFGDAFCELLATHCRQLERFKVTINRESAPNESFTDRAMVALATLLMLTHVDLKVVNITGDALFALVVESVHSDWKHNESIALLSVAATGQPVSWRFTTWSSNSCGDWLTGEMTTPREEDHCRARQTAL
jgi:hypothetical protein